MGVKSKHWSTDAASVADAEDKNMVAAITGVEVVFFMGNRSSSDE